MTTPIRHQARFRQAIISGTREFTKGNVRRQPSDIDQYLDVRGKVLFSEFKYSRQEWANSQVAIDKLSGGQKVFFKHQLVKEGGDSVCAIVRHEVNVKNDIDYFGDVKQFAVLFVVPGKDLYSHKIACSDIYGGKDWYEFNNTWNGNPLDVLKQLRSQISQSEAA